MSRSLGGETIGILGLARSGLGAARLALARGARVYASDAGSGDAVRAAAEEVRRLGGDAEVGGHDVARLARCDRIVLSPGIPPSAAVLREPRLSAVPIVPEIELAAEQLDAPVIAVTGTNGKTTVTALTAHLLQGAGLRAPAGGNIGTALSEVALDPTPPDVVVVEVSSFQLSRVRTFTPAIGVLTNLSPDHLDWYPTVEAYYADKARLFLNASPASRWVVNGEDAAARALLGDAPGERFWFRIASPPETGEQGGFLSPDGWLTLRTPGGGEERLIPASEMEIVGPHNVANALAASIAARLAGAGAREIAAGLRTFRALEHRMEPLGERDGVLWINDSKATNVTSTRVALRSQTRPVVLLLGGRHKGEPYTELVEDARGRVRVVLAYGEAGARIEEDLREHLPVERVDGPFTAVVRRAEEVARTGDVVLLSPACSSYDMFKNYEERGRRFRELALGGAG